MLEVTNLSMEAQLGLDFSHLYKESHLCRYSEQGLFNILASVITLLQMIRICNCSSVIPFIATERTVVYRERFAGKYSLWMYSFAQVKNFKDHM
ncbi:hypothetical protein Pint_17182 [Pistacia integerrima]|uniref:Uncharacterized protein n=1 Tax=Pistacia integerrima TaxID=434235 RepID=A0ACC0Z0I8_9ROSI|nr:hypothetical protein Pint_17182 [Pistacia integerrima]